MGQLTTHVLDTSIGKPAKGIKIKLEFLKNEEWQTVTENITNDDGRVPEFTDNINLEFGTYQITFKTEDYFKVSNVKGFYPYVSIVFYIETGDHYHVPLLLNPYGYSTYRGS